VLRLNRLTDYAIVIATALAGHSEQAATARALAEQTRIPRPTVVKLLKLLVARGVLHSTQGRGGGYALARPPAGIALSDIIEAVEGPIALTECRREGGDCAIAGCCRARNHWIPINAALRRALNAIRLADMAGPGLTEAGVRPLEIRFS
jgi:FeS assembly SUF system regulator